MKTMAKGHLTLLTDLPPNASRGSHSLNPFRSQRRREPVNVVRTEQRVWVGWVMVKETQGKHLRSSGPLPVSSGILTGQ